MASSSGQTPRQKMINLMYIVLTAMLALNVSSDVLDGFTQVNDSLTRSNVNVQSRNSAIFESLESFAEQNPEKGRQWLDKASEITQFTNVLLHQVDSLKLAVVRAADGEDGDPANIQFRDNLEASSAVLLNPATLEGQKLRQNIDAYRTFIVSMIPDQLKQRTIEDALSTENLGPDGTPRHLRWEYANFEAKPVVAAVTLLTKLENDVRYAEGEALSALLDAVDAGDVRVNELNAFVIPRSRSVMRGSKYSANIVLAAVDTTQRPAIYINGEPLAEGSSVYEFSTGATGTFDYQGYLEVMHGDGSSTRHEFSSEYTVFEPTATVSATMMNVLYAGIDNPMSISAPGIQDNQISATMTNGTLIRNGKSWIARPAAVGKEAVITVTARIDGTMQTMGSMTFRTRKLPDPAPYIAIKDAQGNADRYRGGKPLAKGTLLAADGLSAAIDDDMLNINFQVVSFQTVVTDQKGDNIVEPSAGDKFSERQRQQFRNLKRGKRVLITDVKAKGPDGITRSIAPLDVIVN